jgi:hypothetical protein
MKQETTILSRNLVYREMPIKLSEKEKFEKYCNSLMDEIREKEKLLFQLENDEEVLDIILEEFKSRTFNIDTKSNCICLNINNDFKRLEEKYKKIFKDSQFIEIIDRIIKKNNLSDILELKGSVFLYLNFNKKVGGTHKKI